MKSQSKDQFAGLDAVVVDTRKKFDDAIFRCQTGETKTADQLWSELAVEQESTDDGMVSALKCVGILNQLTRRKQISVF